MNYADTDEAFLGYCELHCRTEMALFSREQITRLLRLAHTSRELHFEWACARPDVILPLVETARGIKLQEPREWEIWSEGYAATGEHATAQLLGRATALTFEEACQKLGEKHPSLKPRFDSGRPVTNYGCRLFPAEAEARRSFG